MTLSQNIELWTALILTGYTPTYREANLPPIYNFVQNCRIRDTLVWLDAPVELNRTIPGHPDSTILNEVIAQR